MNHDEKPSRSLSLSRRAFLGLGASVAVAAGAGLSGCAPTASVSTSALNATDSGTTGTAGVAANDTSTPAFLQIPDMVPDSALKETIEADIIIIGSGLSGLCAARAAAENGTDKIIVIEKATEFQCRSNRVGTIGSKIQNDLGVTNDGPSIVSEVMKTCGYRPNQRILNLWAQHSGEAFDWFLAPCANEYVVEAENAPYDGKSLSVRQLRWPVPGDAQPNNDYYPLFNTAQITLPEMRPYLKKTYQTCADLGVEFLFSAWARQLVRANDGKGRIEAVIIEGIEGGYRKITANKAVLLATGDYSSNAEMLQYFTRWETNLSSIFPNTDAKGTKTNTGDGHRMAMWVGGKMENGPHAPMTPHLGGPLGVDGFLAVDAEGERFTNEDVGGQMLQNQISRLPGRAAWQVFDSKWPEQIGFMARGYGNVNHYAEDAAEVPSGSFGKNAYIAREGSADSNTPGFDSYFSDQADGKTSDTIPALAQLMGVDAAAFTATIDRNNALVANGVDEDFNKRSDRFFAVDTPPYYAYPLAETALLVCMGGLVTDTEFRVRSAEDDSPIEGLYAVGNAQGGRFLVDFPLAAPGISHGMAMTHGMLVGKTLASLKKN